MKLNTSKSKVHKSPVWEWKKKQVNIRNKLLWVKGKITVNLHQLSFFPWIRVSISACLLPPPDSPPLSLSLTLAVSRSLFPLSTLSLFCVDLLLSSLPFFLSLYLCMWAHCSHNPVFNISLFLRSIRLYFRSYSQQPRERQKKRRGEKKGVMPNAQSKQLLLYLSFASK